MFLLQPQQHPAPRESVSLSLTSQILIKSLMKRNLQKSRSWHFEVLVSFDCNKLWNFTQIILHRKLKFWYNLVRTFVSGTEFCLDVQSSLYLICNPSIKPGPLYQVGNNTQNGWQFTRTGRVKYCCWVIEDIESKIHIRSHALAKRRNFKWKVTRSLFGCTEALVP